MSDLVYPFSNELSSKIRDAETNLQVFEVYLDYRAAKKLSRTLVKFAERLAKNTQTMDYWVGLWEARKESTRDFSEEYSFSEDEDLSNLSVEQKLIRAFYSTMHLNDIRDNSKNELQQLLSGMNGDQRESLMKTAEYFLGV